MMKDRANDDETESRMLEFQEAQGFIATDLTNSQHISSDDEFYNPSLNNDIVGTI